jgi:hypothetical protein
MNIKKILSFVFVTTFLFLGITKTSFAQLMTPLYFNNAVDSSWDTLGNWWTDASFLSHASAIPSAGDTVYIGATTSAPSIPVTLENIYVATSSTGGGSFSVDLTGATSPVTFYGGSYNTGNINGTATFYENSYNAVNVNGDAFFHDNSSNRYGGAYVHGSATFYDSSYNTYYVMGTSTFYNTSGNNGQLVGNATFHDSSHNNGGISGNATFYDTSSNNYSVYGDAFFSCGAINNSAVSGTISYGVSCPTIISGTLATDNSYMDIVFSEPIWGNNASSTVLTADKFLVHFLQDGDSAVGPTISSITKTTGGALDGSESVVRVNLSINVHPTGVQAVAIVPLNGTSIYNTAGDPMRPEQTTGLKTLNVKVGHRRKIVSPFSTTTVTSVVSESTSTVPTLAPAEMITEIISTTSTSTPTISVVSINPTITIVNPVTFYPYQFLFTHILKLGSTGDEVRQLQIFLNAHNFSLGKTGEGSMGKETVYFGKKTQDALIKFQEANTKDILTPQNLTKGTGIFWTYSKRFANKLLSSSN